MFRGEQLQRVRRFVGGLLGRDSDTVAKRKKPIHARVRKPMPSKPPKVEPPKTAYRRRPKHVKPLDAEP